ncbi:MAG TPA: aminodeoxychorismate synthase component I [Candidatus Angelobacter sp.]|jgi:para-aminobenzoate synthetase/4-amino-4-deoxychorismate lyase
MPKAPGSAGFIALREEDHWRVYSGPQEILAAEDRDSLDTLLKRIDSHAAKGGEAAGFLAYEAGYALEPRLHGLLPQIRTALAWFGLYERCELMKDAELLRVDAGPIVEGAELFISRERYCKKVEEIRELIAAGEIYQLNFTDRLKFKLRDDPWELFAALCLEHPTPYAAFVNIGPEQVLSHSPELFFRIQGDEIAVQPMKGTAPRGLTTEQDRCRAKELQESEKERAENVMIVDLMRSDLGRICRMGSVRATKLFEVTRFPSLWQMTSTIQGELTPGWTFDGVIRALFPSGSVTGAPKIRAMEDIAQLESSSRGVYTGAIGYVARGRAQFNVAIRTSVVSAGEGIMGVGSGITFDSVPAREWEECAWKCGFLTRRTPQFKLFETMLWHDGYVLLGKHIERLASSADYFGFAFDRCRIDERLQEAAAEFSSGEKRRVRFSLARNGEIGLNIAHLNEEHYGQVRIAENQTLSSDCFLFHKTTYRHVYDRELCIARAGQCDDTLFFNERGELTEGAIHNVFVLKEQIWRTPPLECGLLPGTYRAQFLAEHADAREEILHWEDLVEADAIYICNSVRGMYKVKLAQTER